MTWILRVIVAAAMTLALLCALVPATVGVVTVGALYWLGRRVLWLGRL